MTILIMGMLKRPRVMNEPKMGMNKEIGTISGKRYMVWGTGKKTLVFVHYFGGDAGSWQWLIKRLSKKYTCVAINLPGFGDTQELQKPSVYGFAIYINSIVDELGLTDYTMCGHSMGAKLILYAAQLMTGPKPKKLILIAPSPPTVEDMVDSEKKRMLKHPHEEEAKNTVAVATNKSIKRGKFLYAVESQLRIKSNTWQWWITTGMENNIASRISGLKVPAFVICSAKDPIIPIELIFKEVLPHLFQPSLIRLSKSGHLIPLEAPRKLARIIRKTIS